MKIQENITELYTMAKILNPTVWLGDDYIYSRLNDMIFKFRKMQHRILNFKKLYLRLYFEFVLL
jgi:hypothetical protein